MKIICDKCSTEFSFKGDPSGRDIYMVRCPVCKTPITVKMDPYHGAQKRHEKGRMFLKERNIPNDSHQIAPENKMDLVHRDKAAGADINIQQDMINQIENGSDVITDTSDEIYDGADFSGGNSKMGAGILRGLKIFMKGIDPYFIMEKYAPYIYYTFMIFLVFTTLFLFSDFIKLDNMGGNINYWLHSMLYTFKRYV
jgi:predicted Zn finger-like uncharacterized protein